LKFFPFSSDWFKEKGCGAYPFSFDIPFSSLSFLFLAQSPVSAWETPAQMLREG
jgi:hypothetical protein